MYLESDRFIRGQFNIRDHKKANKNTRSQIFLKTIFKIRYLYPKQLNRNS